MDNLKLSQGGSFALTSGGLAEGTNANTYQTANTITFVTDGVLRSKAATNNVAFSAGHATVPVSSSCLYLVCLDSGGNFSTVAGRAVLTAEVTAGVRGLEWPAAPVGEIAVVGAIRVDTNASATFTPGSVDLSASGITGTYFNLFAVPTRPLTA
jgi:hypothetical protein